MGPYLGLNTLSCRAMSVHVMPFSCRVMSVHVMSLGFVLLFLPLLNTETHIERRINSTSTLPRLKEIFNDISLADHNRRNRIRESYNPDWKATVLAKDVANAWDGHSRECDKSQGNSDSPCYKNYRYGCYDNHCWRTMSSKHTYTKYFYNNGDDKGYVKCTNNDQCLNYWKELENKTPGDIPCVYLGSLGNNDYKCFKGIRYTCKYKIWSFGWYCYLEDMYEILRNGQILPREKWLTLTGKDGSKTISNCGSKSKPGICTENWNLHFYGYHYGQ